MELWYRLPVPAPAQARIRIGFFDYAWYPPIDYSDELCAMSDELKALKHSSPIEAVGLQKSFSSAAVVFEHRQLPL
jgi:hypothetical protein